MTFPIFSGDVCGGGQFNMAGYGRRRTTYSTTVGPEIWWFCLHVVKHCVGSK